MSPARRPRRVAERALTYPDTQVLWRASTSPTRQDALLLDTHAWIWTLHNMREQMSNGAWAHIDAAARERRLFVSDISYWEVSLKAAKGQLTLPTHPTLWLGQASNAPGIQGWHLRVTCSCKARCSRAHRMPIQRIAC